MPFQKGNKLGAGSHEKALGLRSDLIRRVNVPKTKKELNEALIEKAKKGDISAIKEIYDRTVGKPAQDVNLSGEVTSKIVKLDIE